MSATRVGYALRKVAHQLLCGESGGCVVRREKVTTSSRIRNACLDVSSIQHY
jgi:hypothetical protein